MFKYMKFYFIAIFYNQKQNYRTQFLNVNKHNSIAFKLHIDNLLISNNLVCQLKSVYLPHRLMLSNRKAEKAIRRTPFYYGDTRIQIEGTHKNYTR